MDVLLISSEDLNPEDTFSSIFELGQAKALIKGGVNVSILSVFLIRPNSLLVSIIFKIIGRSKDNRNAIRFSLNEIIKLYFISIFYKNYVKVLNHNIEGVKVFEGIGFLRHNNKEVEEIIPSWLNTGEKVFYKIYNLKKPKILHAHSRFLYASCLALHIKVKFGLSYVITEHSSRLLNSHFSPALIEIIKNVYNNAEFIFPVSNSLANVLNNNFHIQKLEVIPNMLDDEYLQHLPDNRDSNIFTILSVGRFDDNKNQELLIDASFFLKNEDFKIIFIGDGNTKERLWKKVKENNKEREITFLGHLSKKRIKEEFYKADLLVITSKVETFGVVAIEALSCGVPVVSTNCGGPEDILDESNGLIVSQHSYELSRAIEYVKEHPDAYDRENIRCTCIKRYSSSIIAKRLKNKYELICN